MSVTLPPATAAPVTRWKPYPAYKDSGVAWLGEIPAHWQMKRLKYVVAMNPSVLLEDTEPDYVLQYVDISNVDSLGSILGTQELRFEDAPSRARRVVKQGDTIISTVRTYLRAISVVKNCDPNLVVSTGFAVLRPTSQVHPSFLWRLVQSDEFVNAVVSHSEGVGYPAITPGCLSALPVWLPSFSEQRAISAFLDRESAEIDSRVAKKERLIELLQEKRAALISRAVTQGLDPTVSMRKSGVEWLGEIPAHWNVAPVYSRYTVQLGKMLNQEAVKGIAPAPYLRNVNVQWDRIDTTDLLEMDFDPQERKKFALIPGDLLVCEGGEAGRTAIWRGDIEECYFQKAIHRVRSYSAGEHGRFLFYVLHAAANQRVFVAEGNQSTIVHLTAEKLRKHRFGFPPPPEQQAIAAYLDHETAKLDALIAKVREHIEKLREYRLALISAAVTGKIDVRRAGD